MQQPISITAMSSISSLGSAPDDIWNAYKNDRHYFTLKDNNWIAALASEQKKEIDKLKQANSKYKALDDSVLFAIYTSRQAIKNAN